MQELKLTREPEFCSSSSASRTRCLQVLFQHKALVCDVYIDVVTILDSALCASGLEDALLEAIISHDNDKARGDILLGYADYFFPVHGENPDSEVFRKVRQQHRRGNQHHPEYWRSRLYELSRQRLVATIEMACDWEATSEELGHTAAAYLQHSEAHNPCLSGVLYTFFSSLLTAIEMLRLSTKRISIIGVSTAVSSEDYAATYEQSCMTAQNLFCKILQECYF